MLDKLKDSFDSKNYELNRQIDMKIHKKIAQISGNQYLESLIIRSLGIRVMTFVDLPHKGQNNATQRHLISFDEHRDIIEAIIDGKTERAEHNEVHNMHMRSKATIRENFDKDMQVLEAETASNYQNMGSLSN